MPRVGANGRLNAAGSQRRSVEEPLDGRIWVAAEADVDVDARSRPAAYHLIKSLVVVEHGQFCDRRNVVHTVDDTEVNKYMK